MFSSIKIAFALALRQVRHHLRRSMLTLASIAIGVAAVVAVTVSARTTDQAMDAMYQSLTGHASLEITSIGGGSMDEKVANLIADVSGIETAAAVIGRPTVLSFGDHRVKLFLHGITPSTYEHVHPYKITDGQSLDEAKGVLINAALARNIGVKPGDTVKLLTRRGLIKVRVAGLFQSQETILTSGGASLLMTLSAAQYSSKMPGKISSIQIVMKPGADRDAVAAAIASRLPSGVAVARPATRSSLADETAYSTRQGMLTSRAFLLLVATLIIASTYLISVTQRRRQFGIMRAVGATRGQVAMVLGWEAFLLGLLGSVLGWGIGIVGAHYLAIAMSRLYETTSPAIDLSPASLGLAVLFGVGISLIGASLPARRASRLSPVEAMREVLPTEAEGSPRSINILGILMVVCGSGGLAAGIAGRLPTMANAWSGVLILAGLVLLLPVIVVPMSRLAEWVLRPLMRLESRMARLQLLRHRTRTALTIGVLFVAISTGVGLASSVMDNVNDVKSWYRRAMVADFFVRAMSPDMATGQAADMPDEVGAELAKVQHITAMETARFVSAKANDRSVIVVAHDRGGSVAKFFDSENANDNIPLSERREDDIIVGSVLANRAGGLVAGDNITVETILGPKPLRIAAVVNDYLAGGQTIYMNRDTAERLLGVSGVDAYLIHVDHAHLSKVRRDLENITLDQGLVLESFSQVHEQIDRRMSGVVAGLWSMVIVSFVVAGLGVANTLTMNVLEQTRELGLLRTVGTTQWQIRRIVFAQALMLSLLSLLPGVAVGALIGYLIRLATNPVSGHPVAFTLHPLLWVSALAFSFLVVICVAWFPAQRAAQLPLMDTLRTG
jgi:putative ABC transport system permease protein